MSKKEKIVQLLDWVPEYKMGYILAYIQGLIAYEDNDEFKHLNLEEEYGIKRLYGTALYEDCSGKK